MLRVNIRWETIRVPKVTEKHNRFVLIGVTAALEFCSTKSVLGLFPSTYIYITSKYATETKPQALIKPNKTFEFCF